MSMGGHSSAPDAGAKAPSAVTAPVSDSQMEMTSNQDGPWYAFCQEYSTIEFDHGTDPQEERGMKGHQVPKEAEDGTVEVTRKLKGGTEEEKFNVRKHMVGDLPSCVMPDDAKLRVAIAMVPDPNATEMPMDFDRDIKAIQAAAAVEHYNYTRFWFPWRSSNWRPEKSADPEAEVRRRQEPGILCFRWNHHNPAGQQRLFVLLVGETPTSGVNRIQLAHALYYIQDLRDKNKIIEDERDVVPIAGPHFSASFKAIQDVLRKAVYGNSTATPPEVNLISPDASGLEYLQEFWDFCAAQQPHCTLRSLSMTSQDVTSQAIAYLETLHYNHSSIAQWNESESAFADRQYNDAFHDYGLILRFPRDLSSARSRSDEESAKVAESGSKYFTLPADSPPTRLTAGEPTDRDSPAAFGSEQEEAQEARSLADSVQQMRAHRIGAVVINATNPLDRVYLLEYLHNQLPDVRVVTTQADEIELDRPHFIDLTGTIAVTALPTLAGLRNQIQTAPSKKGGQPPSPQPVGGPITFKSSRQEGEFLAVETLLDSDQAASSGTASPCYYVSVVAENGFRLLPYTKPGKGAGQPVFPCSVATGRNNPADLPAMYFTGDEQVSVSRSFLFFLGLLILLNILHFWCVAASRRCIDRWLSYPRPMVSSLEPTRLHLMFAVNNQLLLLNLLGATIGYAALAEVDGSTSHDWWLIFLFWVVVPLAVATLGFSIYLLIRFLLQVRSAGALKNEIQNVAFALLFLCWTAYMLLSLPALRQGNSIFLERITDLSDGLSPVLPIAATLLGYLLWGFVQLKRLGWATSRNAELEVSAGIEEYFQSRIKSLQARASSLDPAKPGPRAIGLLLVILIDFLLWRSMNGFDGNGFRLWLAVWGVDLLLLAVVLTCLHAWSIWASLRKLLEWLESTPMRETFQQLGDDGLLQIRVWDLAKPQRSFTVLSRTVDSIEQLDGEDSETAKEANSQLKFFLRADANHRQIPPERIELLSRALNVHMDDALRVIYGEDRMVRIGQLRRYLALRVVALIRYAMLQIGALTCFVAYGFVLAVVSVMSYAFAGRQALNVLFVATFLALLISISMMMVQFQRNAMLSRLEGSTPGQVSYGQLALHLLSVGGLPLLAIVTSQFPAVAQFAFSFFRPVLSALH
jgi:hypothetical protein